MLSKMLKLHNIYQFLYNILCKKQYLLTTTYDNHDIESGTNLANPHAKKKKSRWTFWAIYINYGLNGFLFNLFILNPIALILIVCELSINIISTMATTKLTQSITSITSNKITNITNIMNSTVTKSINTAITYTDTDIPTIYEMIWLLIPVMFATDMSTILKRLLRNKSMFYKNLILEKIQKVVINHMLITSPENDKEFSISDQYEALNRFVWVYDNITDTIINTAVQTARSMTLCLYLVWRVPMLLPFLVIVYTIVIKVIIPNTSRKQKGPTDSHKIWERAYYDTSIVGLNKVNPLFNQLYDFITSPASAVNENGDIDSKLIDEKEINLRSNGKTVATLATLATLAPNISHKYMDIIQYYSIRQNNFSNVYDNLKVVYDGITLIIIVILLCTSNYEIALIVLIDRASLFSMIDNYSEIFRCEKNAERSMESIVKILDAVDAQGVNECIQKIPQDIDVDQSDEKRKKIKIIEITGLRISIQAHGLNNQQDKKSDEYDKYIFLDSARVNVTPGKCLMLDGNSGCGKTMTLNALAGLISKNTCEVLTVTFSDESQLKTQFNKLIGSRCIISQNLSNDLNYNGKLSLPMFKLFPGVKTIDEISKYLTDVFRLKPNCIPDRLTDHPHSKLSGGEIQRYVVASQIWKALRLKPDIMILDEIDRALDKDIAVHVIGWITKNLPSFFIVVTHLTEVKMDLIKRRVVEQTWRYDSSDKYMIRIVSTN